MEHKLIMENWRNHLEELDSQDIGVLLDQSELDQVIREEIEAVIAEKGGYLNRYLKLGYDWAKKAFGGGKNVQRKLDPRDHRPFFTAAEEALYVPLKDTEKVKKTLEYAMAMMNSKRAGMANPAAGMPSPGGGLPSYQKTLAGTSVKVKISKEDMLRYHLKANGKTSEVPEFIKKWQTHWYWKDDLEQIIGRLSYKAAK